MDWVKLSSGYPDDVAISTADDAGEVMFTRGLAYCGRAKTGGFIPDSKLQDLTRRPGRARTIAQQLTRDTPLGEPGPWEVVPGGYRIRNWPHWQEQLDALEERRKSDRDRKRKQRSHPKESRDGHVTVTAVSHPQSKRERKTAAAAADNPAAAAAELPTSIAILQAKIQAFTKLQGLRFDGLSADIVTRLEALIDKHGDARLAQTAIDTCRATPPVSVTAFLGTWEALPDPGQRLAVVKPAVCPDHGVQLSPAGICSGCIIDGRVAR